MSNQDVKINIETTADTAGSQAVTKSISQLEKELKDAKDALRNFVGSAAGFDQVKANAKAAESQLNQLQKQVGKLGTRGSNSGAAVLELSRGLEDLQYGVRGILNNIPTLIATLGGSAGLAGVISIVAVGASQLWERLGNSKPTEDKLSKFVTDVTPLLKALKKTFNEVATEQAKIGDDSSLENSFKKRKIAIDAEKAAMDGYISALRTNIQLQGELAKLQTRDALRNVDEDLRAGGLTKKEAGEKKLAIQVEAAQGDYDRQMELIELDNKAQEAKRQEAIQNNENAEKAKALGIQQAEEQKAELETLKRQIALRETFDKQLANLIPLQQKAYEGSVASPGNAYAAPGAKEAQEKAALENLEKAKELWKDIEDIKKRIEVEAPNPIQSLQKKDKDGNEVTIDSPIVKRAKDLKDGNDELGIKPLKDLSSAVGTLTENAKAAAAALEKANSETERQKTTSQQKQAGLDIAKQENPLLKSVEQETAKATNKLMEDILARIPEAANNPQAQALVEKIKNLTGDGEQRGEVDEAFTLIQQLVGKLSQGDDQKAALFKQALENTDAAITSFSQLASKVATTASSLDELKRKINGINQTPAPR